MKTNSDFYECDVFLEYLWRFDFIEYTESEDLPPNSTNDVDLVHEVAHLASLKRYGNRLNDHGGEFYNMLRQVRYLLNDFRAREMSNDL